MKRTGRSTGQRIKRVRISTPRKRSLRLTRKATVEVKYLDTVEPATAVAITGTFSQASLNIIPQDDTASGRTGRQVTLSTVQLRGEVVLPATTVAADTADKIRILVVQDKQTNGANPTAATVLQSAAINAYMNLENATRFKILFDEMIVVDACAGGAPTGTPSFGSVIKPFTMYKKVNIPILYDASAATGALATQRTNNVFVLAFSLKNKATLAYTARVRFTDP